jgi:hypothetical protein
MAAAPGISRLVVHRHHGITGIHWYSAAVVRGFNLYSGSTRLNHHRVTSRTRWYHFTTRHSVKHLWIIAIPRRG